MDVSRFVGQQLPLKGARGEMIGTATIRSAELRGGNLHMMFEVPPEILGPYTMELAAPAGFSIRMAQCDTDEDR